MAEGRDARLERLLDGGLPEDLEARLRNLDRLADRAALGMEDLGRRASGALQQILVKGAEAESVLQRLALSMSEQLLRQVVFRPLGGLIGNALGGSLGGALGGALGSAASGPLLPAAGLVARSAGAAVAPASAAAGTGPISITVNAAGADPQRLRLAVGQAAAQLAHAVERGRREL